MSFWGHSEKLEIFTGARWDRNGGCGGAGKKQVGTRSLVIGIRF